MQAFNLILQLTTCRFAATRELRRVFFAVHAAEKNDLNYPLRGGRKRGLLNNRALFSALLWYHKF
jgi:hypothetical protein